MLSNNIISKLWKVSAVLLVIVVCTFIYFKVIKFNTITTNNVNNPVSSENNNQQVSNTNTGQLEDDNNSSINNNKEDTNDKDTTIKDEINNKKIIILEDRMQGTNCAEAIEYFYEDTEYRYYFTCIKSNSMYVIVNGKEYKLVAALKSGVVTMKELENNGYKFLKESRKLQTK